MKSKYNVLAGGTKVRFLKSGKYEYDFRKGDEGVISRVISPFPKATDTIYFVLWNEQEVWVTGSDIEEFEQIDLEREILKVDSLSKQANEKVRVICPAHAYDGAVDCCLTLGHHEKHMTKHGFFWTYASLGLDDPRDISRYF